MAFWSASARFEDGRGAGGTSDWAVEADTRRQAEDMVLARLAREGLTPARITLTPAREADLHSNLFAGLGTTSALHEGPRRWQHEAGGESLKLATLDLKDGRGDSPDWIAPALWDALFAAPTPARTYAVIDGTIWEQKTGQPLAEALGESGLPAESLFESAASLQQQAILDPDADEAREASAPWLVDLTLPPGVLVQAWEEPGQFHRALFKPRWQTAPGIYLHSNQSLREMRANLRKLTKLRDSDDQWYFNRFWEPEFFLYFMIFLQGRQMLAPLTGLTGFTLLIEGGVVSAAADLSASATAPRDPDGDLDRLFEAGTAMVAIRHARHLEATHERGLNPDAIYELAQDIFGLDGLDYVPTKKFVDIAYALAAFYGDNAAHVLPEGAVEACFDDEGDVGFHMDILHGQCMFGLVQNVPPGDLPQMGVY